MADIPDAFLQRPKVQEALATLITEGLLCQLSVRPKLDYAKLDGRPIITAMDNLSTASEKRMTAKQARSARRKHDYLTKKNWRNDKVDRTVSETEPSHDDRESAIDVVTNDVVLQHDTEVGTTNHDTDTIEEEPPKEGQEIAKRFWSEITDIVARHKRLCFNYSKHQDHAMIRKSFVFFDEEIKELKDIKIMSCHFDDKIKIFEQIFLDCLEQELKNNAPDSEKYDISIRDTLINFLEKPTGNKFDSKYHCANKIELTSNAAKEIWRKFGRYHTYQTFLHKHRFNKDLAVPEYNESHNVESRSGVSNNQSPTQIFSRDEIALTLGKPQKSKSGSTKISK